MKKTQEQMKDGMKQRKKFYNAVMLDMQKVDKECVNLDEDIYRLKYEIQLSDARINVLNAEIEAYKKDKAERDKNEAAEKITMDNHLAFWLMQDQLQTLQPEG